MTPANRRPRLLKQLTYHTAWYGQGDAISKLGWVHAPPAFSYTPSGATGNTSWPTG